MADSATPRIADRRVAVAYSGGRDSTALLHAVCRSAKEASIEVLAFGESRTEVLAFHIHHGLSTHADAWLEHCRLQCEQWAASGLPVRFESRRLAGQPAAGESIEAWAREERYAALTALCQSAGVGLLLLAHHQRDQAETLLLQGLRGAGVAGLAGMPVARWRDGICWSRPWLKHSREAIDAYVEHHQLSHIEDDSNTDPRYARNRLRMSVWPRLIESFPQAEASLAQAAGWAQEALELQEEVAAADLERLDDEGGLDVPGLLQLSPARASNALRAWLLRESGEAAPASLIRRLLGELQPAGEGRWPFAGSFLGLYRSRLNWPNPSAPTSPAPAPSQIVNLASVGLHEQPDWGGAWQVDLTSSQGVSLACLQDLTLRARQGGEQFQRAPASTARSLKKAYQEAGVPAWLRNGPLLFSGENLLFVPGLGLDARMFAATGEPQFRLRWLPRT